MRVLAGSAAVVATFAMTGAAQAQTGPGVTVPSVTVPTVTTPAGDTPPVTTPEVQVPVPPVSGTPKAPGADPGGGSGGGGNGSGSSSSSGSSSGAGSGSVSQPSTLGGMNPGGSVATARPASGAGHTGSTWSSGSRSASGATGLAFRARATGTAGTERRSSAKRSYGAKETRAGATQGIAETDKQTIRPAALAAEAADSGEQGPVIVLWATAFLMLAVAAIVLLRRRTDANGPLARRDPGLPPAPWADWDGSKDPPRERGAEAWLAATDALAVAGDEIRAIR